MNRLSRPATSITGTPANSSRPAWRTGAMNIASGPTKTVSTISSLSPRDFLPMIMHGSAGDTIEARKHLRICPTTYAPRSKTSSATRKPRKPISTYQRWSEDRRRNANSGGTPKRLRRSTRTSPFTTLSNAREPTTVLCLMKSCWRL